MTKRPTRSSRPTRKGPARRPQKTTQGIQLTADQVSWIAGLTLLSIALVTFLSLLSQNRGVLTSLWLDALRYAFGWGAYAIPLGLAVLGVWAIALTTETPIMLPLTRVLGTLILFVSALSLAHHLDEGAKELFETGGRGGIVGAWASTQLSQAFGWTGGMVVSLTVFGIGLTLSLDVSLALVVEDSLGAARAVAAWFRLRRLTRRARRDANAQATAESRQERLPALDAILAEPPPSPTRPEGLRPDAVVPMPAPPRVAAMPIPSVALEGIPAQDRPWRTPSANEILVQSDETQMNLGDIRAKARIIEETLHSLGVPVTVVEVNRGPVVTQFGLEPGYIERRDRDGATKRIKVKVSRISALSNDLALALAASPIRIEAPVPGKAVVGLEVPNRESAVVGLRGVMEADEFAELSGSRLAIALGRDVSGAAVVADLARLPHLLIAGATGSGKSVCINALIVCLLCRNAPDDLKLLMIDPKRVELSSYNGIPHLIAPVVVDAERVVSVLNWVSREMDRRYTLFARVGVRNIQAFNEMATAAGETRMPFIVVCIDELADLMMVSPEDVERAICRIAQMARATGIHLVVATQRPSVDVVTGLIKANFPSRISFAVSSLIDSRVILDSPGAEKLLGRGDALYMAPDSPKLLRVQGCFVTDAEISRLVGFWRGQVEQRADAHQGALFGKTGPIAGDRPSTTMKQRPLWPDMEPATTQDEQDPLLEDALALVLESQRASVSFLQRRLRIGYSRAGRLVDILEAKGIIGPATGTSKAREVLVQPDGQESVQEESNVLTDVQ